MQTLPIISHDDPECVVGGQCHANAEIAFAARDVGVDEIVSMAKVQK